MEIRTESKDVLCNQFKKETDSLIEEVSAIISPLKVTTSEDGDKVTITSGCNLWKSCNQEGCWFSIAARDKNRNQN